MIRKHVSGTTEAHLALGWILETRFVERRHHAAVSGTTLLAAFTGVGYQFMYAHTSTILAAWRTAGGPRCSAHGGVERSPTIRM